MPATVDSERSRRGDARLLAHCSSCTAPPEGRLPAAERLQRVVGARLARILLLALAQRG